MLSASCHDRGAVWRPTSALFPVGHRFVGVRDDRSVARAGEDCGTATRIVAGTCRYSTNARLPATAARRRLQRSQPPSPTEINRKHRRLVSDKRTNNCRNVNSVACAQLERRTTDTACPTNQLLLHCTVLSHTSLLVTKKSAKGYSITIVVEFNSKLILNGRNTVFCKRIIFYCFDLTKTCRVNET